jgi:SnoaL-like domain
MSNNIEAVWERYVRAWKLTSVVAKRELFATCLTPACVYTDPLTVAQGWNELLEYMVAFHAQVPGGHFVTQKFFCHHQRSVARWNMVNADGLTLDEGISYAEYDDAGLLRNMTGFFAPPTGS